MGKSVSAPPPPDYTAAAKQTAEGNLDAARAATAANRVNQVTPYGRLDYSITGADPYGNPTWTATQSLSPAQQQLLDYQNQSSLGLGQLANKGLGYVENMLNTPFDTSGLPQTGINAGEQMSESIMRRLQPQLQQEQKSFDATMANQGIPVGSEAYENAKRMFDQRQNDRLVSSVIQGTQTGLQARQQGFGEASYLRNEPLNTLNAVRTGSQVQGPSFVNSAQQANTAGADILGATQMGYNAQMGAANAQNAANNAMTQGLFSLGGAGIMAMSDFRTKQNIEPIGIASNGLTVYSYEYKDEFKDHKLAGHGTHIGYMAQEVEQVFPYAVRTLDDGYKVVDYGLL
jgi:hypothetical protein